MHIMNHKFNNQRLLLSCSFSLVAKIRLTTPISEFRITKYSQNPMVYYKTHLKNKIGYLLEHHNNNDTENIDIRTMHQYYDIDFFSGVRIVNLVVDMYQCPGERYISVKNEELLFKLSIIELHYSTIFNITISTNSIIKHLHIQTNFNPDDRACTEQIPYLISLHFSEYVQDDIIFVGTKNSPEKKIYFVLIYNKHTGLRYKILESITSEYGLGTARCISLPKEQTLMCIYDAYRAYPLNKNNIMSRPFTGIYGCTIKNILDGKGVVTEKRSRSIDHFKIDFEFAKLSKTSVAHLGDYLVYVNNYVESVSNKRIVKLTWINPNTWIVEDSITFYTDSSVIDIKLVEIGAYRSCIIIIKQQKHQQFANIYYL